MDVRLRYIALSAAALALVVVVLGSYVRLSDAGLACPDWPGCYGQLTVPEGEDRVARAGALFPDQTVVPAGAWKEMIHRYAAGLLGLAVAFLAWVAFRTPAPAHVRGQAALVSGVVIFQALLGMWTVTLQLRPVVVMLHLLGGFAVLGLLWTLALTGGPRRRRPANGAGVPASAALLVLTVQIALGGWTSANYAATACTGFPACNGQWLPAMDFAGALSVDGALAAEARVAVHWAHRVGATATVPVVGLLAFRMRRGAPGLAGLLAGLVTAQFTVGAANVLIDKPLALAVAHNGLAALLLLAVLTALMGVRPRAAAALGYTDPGTLATGGPGR